MFSLFAVMSLSIVPENLVKEDLIFEIASRGGQTTGDVETLRKQFRVAFKQARVGEWKDDLDFLQESETTRRKFEEWSGTLEDYKAEPLMGTRHRNRLYTNLWSLKNRLKVVSSSPEADAEFQEWSAKAVEEVRQLISLLEKAPQETKVERKPETTQTEKEVQPAAPLETVEDGLQNISIEPPNKSILQEPATASERGEMAGGAPGGNYFSYGKLPNPISPLLQRLECVNGLNPIKLIDFLSDVMKILEVPGVDGCGVLKLLMPYCRGPLADRLYEVIREGGSFDTFHELSLNFFVPSRVVERMKSERIFRDQRSNEELGHYVHEVRSTCRVLRLALREGEVVSSVLEGLNPEERNRLSFQPRPTNYVELDRLCVISRNISVADRQRARSAPMVGAVGYGPPLERREWTRPPESGWRPPPAPEGTAGPRRNQGCYNCGELGHIRRFCPKGAGAIKGDAEKEGPKN